MASIRTDDRVLEGCIAAPTYCATDGVTGVFRSTGCHHAWEDTEERCGGSVGERVMSTFADKEDDLSRPLMKGRVTIRTMQLWATHKGRMSGRYPDKGARGRPAREITAIPGFCGSAVGCKPQIGRIRDDVCCPVCRTTHGEWAL